MNRRQYLNIWLLAIGLLTSGSQVDAVGMPSLVKDITVNPASSNVLGLTRVGDTVFFAAEDGVHGQELWKTDGTPGGTTLVKDVLPGPDSAFNIHWPMTSAELNGVLFFTADDGTHSGSSELWKSDGTEGGTILVKDIHPTRGSNPSDLFVFNDQLFFSADDGTNGRELWKTDGKEAGTVMVKDINPSGNSGPTEFFEFNGTLLFSADGGSDKRQLWKTDGTEAGTNLLKIINQTGDSNPKGMALYDGKVFFSASNGPDGAELWSTDGTSENTEMFLDISHTGSSGPSNLTEIDGLLYFGAAEFPGVRGLEPWVSNGVPTWGTGTRRFASLGKSPIGSNPGRFTKYKDEVFFTAAGHLGTPYSDPGTIWKTDGTFKNTVALGSPPVPSKILVVGGMMYLLSNEIWVSDGTLGGTAPLSDQYPVMQQYPGMAVGQTREAVDLNGVLITVGFDEDHGNELWLYDPAGSGPELLKDINSGTTGSSIETKSNSSKASFIEINGVGYFTAGEGGAAYLGQELWKSDGTQEGTSMVKDINPGKGSSGPLDFYYLPSTPESPNGLLLFTADDGTHGRELWKSDGTEAGTMLVKDITETNPFGTDLGTEFVNFAVVDGTLFFSAKNRIMKYMLWKSDGTEEGTVLVKELSTGQMVAFQGALFMSASVTTGSVVGVELWTSDGTGAGTVLLKDINESGSSSPRDFTVVGDTLYFKAYLGYNDYDLWKTNGTPESTVEVKDFSPGGSPGFGEMFSFRDRLYFTGSDGTPGEGLWTSDGTDAGTTLVTGVYPDALASGIDEIFAGDDFIYFLASPESMVVTTQLWRTDGTAIGTVPITINLPNEAEVQYYSIAEFAQAHGSVYFIKPYDEIYGRELWITDGTDVGTRPLVDLIPGPTGSNASILGVIGEAGTDGEILLFRGNDQFHGDELWKVGATEDPTRATFAAWKATQFTAEEQADPGISGPDSDPDDDGITNLAEYVHYNSPHQANASPVEILLSERGLDLTNGVTAIFVWADGMTDVGYELQVSTDLESWERLESAVVNTAYQPLSRQITLWAESTDIGATEVFFRLRVFELQ